MARKVTDSCVGDASKCGSCFLGDSGERELHALEIFGPVLNLAELNGLDVDFAPAVRGVAYGVVETKSDVV